MANGAVVVVVRVQSVASLKTPGAGPSIAAQMAPTRRARSFRSRRHVVRQDSTPNAHTDSADTQDGSSTPLYTVLADLHVHGRGTEPSPTSQRPLTHLQGGGGGGVWKAQDSALTATSPRTGSHLGEMAICLEVGAISSGGSPSHRPWLRPMHARHTLSLPTLFSNRHTRTRPNI